MSKRKSWIAEMHRIVEEREGLITEDDVSYVERLMMIPNDDISIEKVTFENRHNYF